MLVQVLVSIFEDRFFFLGVKEVMMGFEVFRFFRRAVAGMRRLFFPKTGTCSF